MAKEPYKVLLLLPQCGLTEGQGEHIIDTMRFIGKGQEQWRLYVAGHQLHRPEELDPVIAYFVEKTKTKADVLSLPKRTQATRVTSPDCDWLYAWAVNENVDEIWCCPSLRNEKRGKPAQVYARAQRGDAKTALKFKRIPPWVAGKEKGRDLAHPGKAKTGAEMRKGTIWNGEF